MRKMTAWAGGIAQQLSFPADVADGVLPVTSDNGQVVGWELAAAVVMAGRAEAARLFHAHWTQPAAVTVLGPTHTVQTAARWLTARTDSEHQALARLGSTQSVPVTAIDATAVLVELTELEDAVGHGQFDDDVSAGCGLVDRSGRTVTWLADGSWGNVSVELGRLHVPTTDHVTAVVHTYDLDGVLDEEKRPVPLTRETMRDLGVLAPGSAHWTTRPLAAPGLALEVLGRLAEPARRSVDGTVWIADH